MKLDNEEECAVLSCAGMNEYTVLCFAITADAFVCDWEVRKGNEALRTGDALSLPL